MKKALALILALVMVMSLAACGGNGGSSTPAPATDAPPAATDAPGAEPTEAPDESGDFLVGAIYINSQNDTSGYTFQHHEGISTAMENLGLDPSTQLRIVDNVPEDDTQVANAIDSLAGQGCDIIFGISFGYINAMAEAAEKEEYADIIFSHATGYLSNETNFNNYFGRIYQARYLAGIAAGMKSLALGNNNIGYVAAWNLEYAETCSGINAFALGAQSVNPDATVYVNQISTWGDETLERQSAQMLIDTYDCCVITQHCDSAQPQLAAQDNGAFGCGYNSDMTEQAPNAHLTSAIWHWNVYYQLAIETAMNEPRNFMSKVGIYYGGLAEGFVDISPLNGATVVEGTQEMIDQVRDMMISGEWDVFSGVKLSFDDDGNVVKTDAALMDNEGNEIVAAGGPSVDDGVIKGSMNYNIKGVVVG